MASLVPLEHYTKTLEAIQNCLELMQKGIDDLNERVKVLEDNKK
jgi:hypothetical protein